MATTSYEVIRKKRNGVLLLYGDGFAHQDNDQLQPEPLGVWNQIESLKINKSKNMLKIMMSNGRDGPVFTFVNEGDLDRVKDEIGARQVLASNQSKQTRRGADNGMSPALEWSVRPNDPARLDTIPRPPTGLTASAPPGSYNNNNQYDQYKYQAVPQIPVNVTPGRRPNQPQPQQQLIPLPPVENPEREKKRLSAKPLPPPKKPTLDGGGSTHHKKKKVEEEWSEERPRLKLVHYIYILCVLTTCWCATTAFSKNPKIGNLRPTAVVAKTAWSTGCKDGLEYCVCPRATICADELEDMIFLGIARSVVYFVYPFIWFLFLSKANFLHSWLQTTVVSVVVDFSEFHHLHRWGGILVEGATWVHVFFHLLRWGLRGHMDFLFESQTGVTGLIATIIMPFITWPMAIQAIKTKLNFEIRKSMHYLSWIWGVCLILHAPQAHIIYLCGVPTMIYWLNWIIGCFWGTYLVPSTIFRRLESGVSMTFDNPKGFELKGPSYIVVMLPWITKYQWHAFSIFPQQDNHNQSSVCIAAVGDWSKQLHATTLRPTARPAWISGPFLSPFATAIHFDNIITLATGIGITPALCTVNMYRGTRRINLIWMCRDPSFVEFFVSTVDFPPDAFVLIYYTGKKQLVLPDHIPSNIFIFAGRPALERVVAGLVECIEKEEGLPEEVVEEGKAIHNLDPARKFRAVVSRLLKIYSETRIYESCLEASKADMAGQENTTQSKRELHSASNLRNRRRSTTHTVGMVGGEPVAITKKGLTTAVNDFLGYDEFSPADVDAIFDMFDADHSGAIDQEEYDAMMDYVYAANDDEIDPAWGLGAISEEQDNDEEDVESPREAKGIVTHRHFFSPLKKGETPGKSDAENYASKQDLSTWQMLYCGGSAPVVEQLEMINQKYGIDLKIEKFDW